MKSLDNVISLGFLGKVLFDKRQSVIHGGESSHTHSIRLSTEISTNSGEDQVCLARVNSESKLFCAFSEVAWKNREQKLEIGNQKNRTDAFEGSFSTATALIRMRLLS
jgi:hypothetical protein